MNDMNWTDLPSYAKIAAEELSTAFSRHDIGYMHVVGEDTLVHISFPSIRDAETMMTLGVEGSHLAGGLYDRSTSGCLGLSHLPADASEEDVNAVIDASWTWVVHPHMTGRRMGWHVAVDMPVEDANAVTANLNTIANGGAV